MGTDGESAQSDGFTTGDGIHEFRFRRSLKRKGRTASVGAKRKSAINIPVIHNPWLSLCGRMKTEEPVESKAGPFGTKNSGPLGSIEGSGQIDSPREGEDVARCRCDIEQ